MKPVVVPVVLLILTLGCERSPASPTTVTTIVTSPTSPTPVTTIPVTTQPNPTCPTCPTTCTPTVATPTCPSPTTPGVGSRAPEVSFFGAEIARITKGGSAILRWEVSDPSAQVRLDPGIGSVGAVGFVLVSPPVTTTYTLTARNAIATVQRQFTIVVVSAE